MITIELITGKHMKRAGKYFRGLFFISLIGLVFTALCLAGVLLYAKILGPPPLAVPQSTLFYSDDGTVIGESHNGQKRYWMELEDISPHLVDATVSIEDRKFYTHHGFDYIRIAGAVFADIKAMAKVQGASTITQQYARNLFLEHDKTWKRKIKEAFYTIRLEMSYSKEEILEGYLNTIYYGNGAYGAEAASQFYFGKSASDLSLAEASLLAGIPKGAGLYSPLVSKENAKARQKIILNSMVENSYIDKKSAEAAYNESLTVVGKHLYTKAEVVAPYFQDAVRQALKKELKLDDRVIELGGLRVYTTLDLKQQEIAEKTVARIIPDESDIQAALVSMNPKNGHVKAMVGGRSYEESPFNRAVQAVRQPGSTIKPLLYYAALEHGFTPSTLMRSEETTFRFEDRPDYSPSNFNSQYAEGDITMAQALAVSDNIYAIKTHLFLGEDTLVETAKKFGIKSAMKEVPSLALGTSGVKVIEMANAYSMLANGGKQTEPVFIKKVESYNGEVIYERKNTDTAVLRSDLAYVMTHMMTGVFDRKLNGYTSVTGSSIIDDITRTYAGKSGSTDTDSWMIGYSPQLVSAVWTGYDKGKTIHLTADKLYAKNIWVHFMEDALKDTPAKGFKAVKGTVGVYVNPENGKLATEQCPVKRFTYFAEGTEPTEYCTEHISHEEKPAEKAKETKKPWYKKLFDWF